MTQDTIQEISSNSNAAVPKRRWVELAISSGVLVALIQVLPQLVTAVVKNVPWQDVPFGRAQENLFLKNLECLSTRQPQPAADTPTMTVSLLVCPSGDTLVGLNSKTSNREIHRWVSPETFERDPVAFGEFLVPSAMAITPQLGAKTPETATEIAQAPTVLCQALRDGKLIRNLRYGDGRCEQEVTNTFTGEVTRTAIVCSASC